MLALHAAGPNDAGRVHLALAAEEPLEQIAERVQPYRGIADEAFGHSLVLQDPNGMRIQVNEHDRSLSTQAARARSSSRSCAKRYGDFDALSCVSL